MVPQSGSSKGGTENFTKSIQAVFRMWVRKSSSLKRGTRIGLPKRGSQ